MKQAVVVVISAVVATGCGSSSDTRQADRTTTVAAVAQQSPVPRQSAVSRPAPARAPDPQTSLQQLARASHATFVAGPMRGQAGCRPYCAASSVTYRNEFTWNAAKATFVLTRQTAA